MTPGTGHAVRKPHLLALQSWLHACSTRGRQRGRCTCLADDGRVGAQPRVVAQPADVLAEHAERVLVPHHQVGHGAAGTTVVLIDREPLLERERERERETERESQCLYSLC